jgi:YVTN family beta-propeller protein
MSTKAAQSRGSGLAELELRSKMVTIGPFPELEHIGISSLVPERRILLVPSQDNDCVNIVSLDSRSLVKTIQLPRGGMPWYAKATPDGKFAYVTNSRFSGHIDTSPRVNSTVSVIDLERMAYVCDIPVHMGPAMVEMDPIRDRAYVTNLRSNTVVNINTKTHEVVDSLEVGFQPMWVRITPRADLLVVGNFGDATLSLIDPVSFRVLNRCHVGVPYLTKPFPEFGPGDTIGIAITERGTAYVANWRSQTVSIVDVYSAAAGGASAVVGCEHPSAYPFGIEIDEKAGVVVIGSYNLHDSKIVVLEFNEQNEEILGPKIAEVPIYGDAPPTGKAAGLSFWFSQPFESRIIGFVPDTDETLPTPEMVAVVL